LSNPLQPIYIHHQHHILEPMNMFLSINSFFCHFQVDLIHQLTMIVISSSCSITTIPNPLIPTTCSYSLTINRCRKWCHIHPCHLQAMITKFTFLSSHIYRKISIIITITTTTTLSTPKPIYILDQLSIASTLNP